MSVIISKVAHNDDNKPGQDDGGEDDGDDEPEKEGKEPT